MSRLVLTRSVGEEVVVGDPVSPLGRVRVVGIDNGRVRLAFDFGRDVEIHRDEVATLRAFKATHGGEGVVS